MKNQILIKKKQKEILAEFYSNFALAWVTFGVIAPFFNKIDSPVKTIIGMIESLLVGTFFLAFSLKFIK